MKPRAGIVSFAHLHAHDYASALGDLSGLAEFVGITDDNPSRGREAAERYRVRFFEDAKKLFEETEAVIVCSENSKHLRDVSAALEGGVHVLCEKPIATTTDDARAMIEASRRANLQLRIAFPVRYTPAVRQAKQVIESGEIGRIIAVNGTNHGKIPGGWFLEPEASGGGAVMDHTVHVADLLRWMLGTEVQSVYAEIGTFFGDGEIDDGAILTLELENGTFSTIDPSWSRGAGYPTWGDLTLQIVGTRGVISVDAFAPSLTVFNHDTSSTEFLSTGEDMNRLMLEDFLSGVRKGAPAGASAEDGLRTLEVALAAYRSGRDHEPKHARKNSA